MPSPCRGSPCLAIKRTFCNTLRRYCLFCFFSFTCVWLKLSPMSLVVLGRMYNFSIASLCTSLSWRFLNKVVASFQLLKPLTVNDGSQFPFPTDTFLDFSALQHVWQHTESIHTQNVESYWKLKRMKGVVLMRSPAIWMNSCGGKDGEKHQGLHLTIYVPTLHSSTQFSRITGLYPLI